MGIAFGSTQSMMNSKKAGENRPFLMLYC